MKKNIIINLITLSTTSLLLVFLALAWYVENKNVSANNIIGASAGDEYTLRLERGEFVYGMDDEGVLDWHWEWTPTTDMTFYDIQPGDAFFFRIVLETDGTQNFSLKFGDIKSSLVDDSLYAYKNDNLVEYEKTTDTTPVENKNYYTASFTRENVTVGNYVKPYAYYEFDSTSNKYVLTSDETFKEDVNYYRAKFILAEVPELNKNVYYTRIANDSTEPNAIGYKYSSSPVSYNYMYPLYSDNTVKVVNTKGGVTKEILYEYDDENDEVKLKDYLIEDVVKVYDIGVKYGTGASATYYHDAFNNTDQIYQYGYRTTTDTTPNPKKVYYVNSSFRDKVVFVGSSFNEEDDYYERTTTAPTLKYSSNHMLKGAEFTFDTAGNEENVTYYYFALEFNEAESLYNIDGINSSNCFLYQKLSINELRVDLIKEED